MSIIDRLHTLTAERLSMLLLAVALIVWLCVATCIRQGSRTVSAPDVVVADTVVADKQDVDSVAPDSLVAGCYVAHDTIVAGRPSGTDSVTGKRSRARMPRGSQLPGRSRDHLHEPISE